MWRFAISTENVLTFNDDHESNLPEKIAANSWLPRLVLDDDTLCRDTSGQRRSTVKE